MIQIAMNLNQIKSLDYMDELNTTHLRQNLVSQLEKFELWSKGNKKSVSGKAEIYSDWSKLSTAFICFLKSKLTTNLSPADEELIARACRTDWYSRKLFSTLPESEWPELLRLPYSDIELRMYMLISARNCNSIKMEVALFYFNNDPSDVIRDEALVILAGGSWPEAEGHALSMWKTRKTVKRMSALSCLRALESPLLDEYLQKGLNSRDGGVRRHAQAIFSIKNMDKMNWPKPL